MTKPKTLDQLEPRNELRRSLHRNSTSWASGELERSIWRRKASETHPSA